MIHTIYCWVMELETMSKCVYMNANNSLPQTFLCYKQLVSEVEKAARPIRMFWKEVKVWTSFLQMQCVNQPKQQWEVTFHHLPHSGSGCRTHRCYKHNSSCLDHWCPPPDKGGGPTEVHLQGRLNTSISQQHVTNYCYCHFSVPDVG